MSLICCNKFIRITSKNIIKSQRRFLFSNCFNSYTTKNKLKEHEEICNNHDSCRVEMPNWVNKMLEHNPGEKSLKAPYAFYIYLEYIFKKLESSQNNPEKTYTEKKPTLERSGWSIFY